MEVLFGRRIIGQEDVRTFTKTARNGTLLENAAPIQAFFCGNAQEAVAYVNGTTCDIHRERFCYRVGHRCQW